MPDVGRIELAKHLLDRLFDSADNIVKRVTSFGPVLLLSVTVLGVTGMEIFGLGQSPTFALALATKLGDLLATKWAAWGGWAFSLALAGLLSIVLVSCYGAQNRQGDDLARLRKEKDPHRVSSRDPKSLGEYPQKAAARRQKKQQARSASKGVQK